MESQPDPGNSPALQMVLLLRIEGTSVLREYLPEQISIGKVAKPLRCCRMPAGLPESGGVAELQPEEVGEGWQISFFRMPQRTASASNRW